MSKKSSRTYRFSEAALSMIEKRDREKYYYANDFVEARILEVKEEEKEERMLMELKEIKDELVLLKSVLAGMKQQKQDPVYDELPTTNYRA